MMSSSCVGTTMNSVQSDSIFDVQKKLGHDSAEESCSQHIGPSPFYTLGIPPLPDDQNSVSRISSEPESYSVLVKGEYQLRSPSEIAIRPSSNTYQNLDDLEEFVLLEDWQLPFESTGFARDHSFRKDLNDSQAFGPTDQHHTTKVPICLNPSNSSTASTSDCRGSFDRAFKLDVPVVGTSIIKENVVTRFCHCNSFTQSLMNGINDPKPFDDPKSFDHASSRLFSHPSNDLKGISLGLDVNSKVMSYVPLAHQHSATLQSNHNLMTPILQDPSFALEAKCNRLGHHYEHQSPLRQTNSYLPTSLSTRLSSSSDKPTQLVNSCSIPTISLHQSALLSNRRHVQRTTCCDLILLNQQTGKLRSDVRLAVYFLFSFTIGMLVVTVIFNIMQPFAI